MTDVYDKEKRSSVMRQVRSSGNRSTELKLIDIFKTYGFKGWRRNYRVKGRPDFVFLNSRTAIFTDGCFWHGHNCRNVTPKQNSEYWEKKRERNIRRDKAVTAMFEARGWKVLRIWECELKPANRGNLAEKLREVLSRGVPAQV